jgi:hypothetical protein
VWTLALVLGLGLMRDGGTVTQAGPAHVVRVAYIVPSDRAPQADYAGRIDELLRAVQRFYAEEMSRHGFGRATFRLEEDSEGATRVHLVHAAMSAAVFAAGGHAKYATSPYWDNAVDAARAAGLPIWADGQVWILFSETHVQNADGSISFATSQASGTPMGGVALISADKLALGRPELLADARGYDAVTIPGLGPYPLRDGVSYPWYSGHAVGSLAACEIGAVAHELGHCFLLQHGYLNDANFDGCLMGNGFRGWRGYALPEEFPDEDARLTRADALALSLSPFFHDQPLSPAGAPPQVLGVKPEGTGRLVDGCVEVRYRVAATEGVALITLENGTGRDGVGVVADAEWPRHPERAQGVLRTSEFTVDREEHWRLRVFDARGNTAERDFTLRVARGQNTAPRPFIRTRSDLVRPGEEVTLDATATRDLEGGPLLYEWDFGDGETAEGDAVRHAYSAEGVYSVVLRVSDAEGAIGSVPMDICVRN